MSGWKPPLGATTALGLALGGSHTPMEALPWLGPTALGAWALTRWSRRLRAPASALLVLALAAGTGTLRTPPPPPVLPGAAASIVAGRVVRWEPRRTSVAVEIDAHRIDGLAFRRPCRIALTAPASWGGETRSSWVRVRGRLVPERGITNPGQRDPGPRAGRLLPTAHSEPEWGPGRPGRFTRIAGALHARCLDRFPGFAGRLASAVLLGRSSALTAEETETFRRSGASHLVAVSGQHVGLAALLAALVMAPFGRPIRFLTGAAAALGYAALVGWTPSAARAAAMVAAFSAGAMLGRPRPTIAWLTSALAVLLWADPRLAANVSLRLSAGAVAGLCLGLALAPRAKGPLRGLLAAAAAGLGAQWGTLGVAVAVFGLLPPLSLLPNLVAVPLSGLLLPAVLLGLPDHPAAPLFRLAAAGLSAALRGTLAAGADHLPLLEALPVPPAWTLLLAPALVVAWFGMPGGTRSTARWRGVFLTAAILIPAVVLAPWPPARGPWVAFLDVEQGDAAVLHLSDGSTWLVDAGDDRGPGDAATNVIVPFLRHARIRRLDAVVLSHRHRDHVGGLGPLLDRFPVDIVLDAGYGAGRGGTADAVDSLLAAAGVSVRRVARGDTLARHRGGDVVVLHPPPPPELPPGLDRNLNDVSIVLLIRDRGLSLLLAGDLERPGEACCLAGGVVPAVNVLKVGHHGSATSTGEGWLATLRPRAAVISCGAGNRYGHPSASTLDRLDAAAIRVHRTDVAGAAILRLRPGGLDLLAHPPRGSAAPAVVAVSGL